MYALRAISRGSRDHNEPEIILAFAQCGVEVWRKLPLDLIIPLRGQFHLAEVKNPAQSPRDQRLTEIEQRFWDATMGYPRHILKTGEDVLNLVNFR